MSPKALCIDCKDSFCGKEAGRARSNIDSLSCNRLTGRVGDREAEICREDKTFSVRLSIIQHTYIHRCTSDEILNIIIIIEFSELSHNCELEHGY